MYDHEVSHDVKDFHWRPSCNDRPSLI